MSQCDLTGPDSVSDGLLTQAVSILSVAAELRLSVTCSDLWTQPEFTFNSSSIQTLNFDIRWDQTESESLIISADHWAADSSRLTWADPTGPLSFSFWSKTSASKNHVSSALTTGQSWSHLVCLHPITVNQQSVDWHTTFGDDLWIHSGSFWLIYMWNNVLHPEKQLICHIWSSSEGEVIPAVIMRLSGQFLGHDWNSVWTTLNCRTRQFQTIWTN